MGHCSQMAHGLRIWEITQLSSGARRILEGVACPSSYITEEETSPQSSVLFLGAIPWVNMQHGLPPFSPDLCSAPVPNMQGMIGKRQENEWVGIGFFWRHLLSLQSNSTKNSWLQILNLNLWLKFHIGFQILFYYNKKLKPLSPRLILNFQAVVKFFSPESSGLNRILQKAVFKNVLSYQVM